MCIDYSYNKLLIITSGTMQCYGGKDEKLCVNVMKAIVAMLHMFTSIKEGKMG